jgi:hypothetical protein
MALCTIRHTSTSTGSIIDDKVNWAFLLDMSDVGTVTAMSVTYSNNASHIPKSNVQDVIDYMETQVVALNNVNVTQGDQITAIQTKNTTQDTRLDTLETKTTGVVTAQNFVATDGINTQFGGNAAVGIAANGTRIAILPPAGTKIDFATWGNWKPAGLSITGTLDASGRISGAGATINGTLLVTADATMQRSPGATTGLIFFGNSGGVYLYFDGANWSHVGGGAVYGPNGRLWGANDTLPNTTPANVVTGIRMVYVGDAAATGSTPEPYGGAAVVSGMWFNGSYQAVRYRQLQMFVNGGWTPVTIA